MLEKIFGPLSSSSLPLSTVVTAGPPGAGGGGGGGGGDSVRGRDLSLAPAADDAPLSPSPTRPKIEFLLTDGTYWYY